MIDQRELGIGNLVHAINRSSEIHLPGTLVLQVVEIKIDGIRVVPLGINPAQVAFIKHSDTSPIELTPDWLERAGLQKFSCPELVFRFGDYSIKMNDEGIFELDLSHRGLIRIVKLPYVHSAQNAWYFLTGKELDFKPGTGGI